MLDWNDAAKAFYRRLGARRNEAWEPWRLDGEALAALQEDGRRSAGPTAGVPKD